MPALSVPVLLLSGVGVIIAMLALLGGNFGLTAMGLGAVFAAGALHVAEIAVRSRVRGRDEADRT